jgi:hypothetical protein
MSSKLLVYGATGFVGGHIARTAVGAGLPTIVAGRDAAKVELVAAELGAERRAFGLTDAGAIAEALSGVAVVLARVGLRAGLRNGGEGGDARGRQLEQVPFGLRRPKGNGSDEIDCRKTEIELGLPDEQSGLPHGLDRCLPLRRC